MTIALNPTLSTGSRAAQRIAIAAGGAAIAAVAFSGAASATPFSYSNNSSFGHTTVTSGFNGNIPSPSNHNLTFNGGGGAVNTLGGVTALGSSLNVNLNPAHPFKPTVLVSGTAGTTHFGGAGGTLTGGISNGLPSLHFTPF